MCTYDNNIHFEKRLKHKLQLYWNYKSCIKSFRDRSWHLSEQNLRHFAKCDLAQMNKMLPLPVLQIEHFAWQEKRWDATYFSELKLMIMYLFYKFEAGGLWVQNWILDFYEFHMFHFHKYLSCNQIPITLLIHNLDFVLILLIDWNVGWKQQSTKMYKFTIQL